MKTISQFNEILLRQLKTSSYVLLAPIPVSEKTRKLDILYPKEELPSLVDNLGQLKELNTITLASSFKSSKAVLKFKDNAELIINFIHKFSYNSLTYLDESEVMGKKVRGYNEINIPCVEHLFEHRILNSFLELKGIGRATFQYFNEFHILVQEDLLEYFNLKYGTSFSNIYQLTDFDANQRLQIIKKLKSIPTNGFIKKVNTQWHSFLGAVRQTRLF